MSDLNTVTKPTRRSFFCRTSSLFDDFLMLLDTPLLVYTDRLATFHPVMLPVSAVEESQTSDQPKGELATESNNGPNIGHNGDPLKSGQRKNPLSRRLRLEKKSDCNNADGIVEPITDESTTSNRKNPSKQNKRTSSDDLSGNKRGPETSQASSNYLSGNKQGPETLQVLGVGVHATRSIKEPDEMVSNQLKRQREEPSALCAHHILTPRGTGGLTCAPLHSSANPNDLRVSPQQSCLIGGMRIFAFSKQKTHPSQPSMPPPSISNCNGEISGDNP